MKQRGQIYLIATVIIIAIISSFTLLSDYNKQENSNFIYDLKKQLEIESEKVLDYGFTNESDIEDLTENFAEDFSDYVGSGIDIYFISGETGNMGVYYFDDGKQIISSSEEENNLNFAVVNITYNCEVNEGYNFYFIIVEEKGGEKYVENSEGCTG